MFYKWILKIWLISKNPAGFLVILKTYFKVFVITTLIYYKKIIRKSLNWIYNHVKIRNILYYTIFNMLKFLYVFYSSKKRSMFICNFSKLILYLVNFLYIIYIYIYIYIYIHIYYTMCNCHLISYHMVFCNTMHEEVQYIVKLY